MLPVSSPTQPCDSASRHSLSGDEILTVTEAARLLHLHRGTVYREIATGHLPAIIGEGHRTLIWRSDLDAFLADRYSGAKL